MHRAAKTASHDSPQILAALAWSITLRIVAGVVIIAAVAGCDRKHSEAIVLEKEHIAVQAPTPSPGPSPAAPTEAETEPREMAADEIDVDGVVMKKEVRGTSRDPRASANEQWLVKVKTMDNGRTFNVHADKTHFDKLRVGDRVGVSYRVGKYTGTVWSADFE